MEVNVAIATCIVNSKRYLFCTAFSSDVIAAEKSGGKFRVHTIWSAHSDVEKNAEEIGVLIANESFGMDNLFRDTPFGVFPKSIGQRNGFP